MVAFWSPYGSAKGNELHVEKNLVWFYTGVPFALFNGVLFAQLEEKNVLSTIEILGKFIGNRGAPALWWLGPRSKPDNLRTLLEQKQLKAVGDVTGMAINLDQIRTRADAVPGLAVTKVGNKEEQALWARIAAEGTGFSESATAAFIELETSLSKKQYQNQKRYIGYLNGEPVASSAMTLDSGVAGIYAVSTLPEARRKGIGAVMTAIPLFEAREQGYHVGILQASSMGLPVYKKMGFKEVCRYQLYLQS